MSGNNPKVSVTSMQHRLLYSMDAAPFDDIVTEDHQGHTEYYTFDSFRRLYNDAVESMNSYRRMLGFVSDERDFYRNRCHDLEDQLRELSEE